MNDTKEQILAEFEEEDKAKNQIEPQEDVVVVSEKKETSEPIEEKKASRTQKRIDNLVAEKHELKAKVAELSKARNEEAKEGDETSSLKLEDFEDYDSYLEALTKEEDETEPITAGSLDQNEAIAEFDLALEQFNNKLEDAREKHKDFDDKVFGNEAIISQDMVVGFNDSEQGAELAYYYATNPIEAIKVSKMSGRKLIKALTLKEIELGSPKAIIQKQTNAPEPISIQSGGSQNADIDTMSVNEMGAYFASRKSTW